MCGRYTMAVPADTIRRLFELGEVPDLPPRYNIAPSQMIPAVVQPQGGPRQFRVLKWGLVPFWAKDPSIGNRMINARSESAGEKPAFRAAMKYRRCLLPADGFYEWKKTPSGKQPLYVQRADGELFALGGLWESWESPQGEVIDSATILTTTSNALLREVHDRMPVIIPREHFGRWLDPARHDPAELVDLLQPYPPERMKMTPVSRTVNSPVNETPECVRPVI